MNNETFPVLEKQIMDPTWQTLHWYTKAMGVIPRVHAESHPKWWHVSLQVTSDGLKSNPMTLPDGRIINLNLNVKNHAVEIITEDQILDSI
ncbi:MAG: DUF5996 family protein, partial [Chloroflexota bacterium]